MNVPCGPWHVWLDRAWNEGRHDREGFFEVRELWIEARMHDAKDLFDTDSMSSMHISERIPNAPPMMDGSVAHIRHGNVGEAVNMSSQEGLTVPERFSTVYKRERGGPGILEMLEDGKVYTCLERVARLGLGRQGDNHCVLRVRTEIWDGRDDHTLPIISLQR